MSNPTYTQEQYAQALLNLLPNGLFWDSKNYPLSNMYTQLYPLANVYTYTDSQAVTLINEANPATTLQMIPEWEESLGLPSPCIISYANTTQAQQAILTQFLDSGGCSLSYFQSVANALGFEVEITQYTPTRVGSHIGAPLVTNQAAFEWTMQIISGSPASLLVCEMARRNPAHLRLTVIDIDGSLYYPYGSGVSDTRSTTATYFDQNGNLQIASAYTARPLYIGSTFSGYINENASTNYIRNPLALNATTGTFGVGSGAVYPTDWGGFTTGYSLNCSIVGTGTENGISYIDYRFHGNVVAPVSTINPSVYGDAGGISTTSNSVTTTSVYVALANGSIANFNSFTVFAIEHYANGVFDGHQTGTTFTPTSNALSSQRVTVTSNAHANTAYIIPAFQCQIANGAHVDATIRIGGFQVEYSTYASSLILPAANTIGITTRAADLLSFGSPNILYPTVDGKITNGVATFTLSNQFRTTTSSVSVFYSAGTYSGTVTFSSGVVAQSVVLSSGLTTLTLSNAVNCAVRLLH